jgi:hypothetical protein
MMNQLQFYNDCHPYNYTDVIILNKNEIVKLDNIIFGNFYMKVKNNFFFRKWSNVYFLLKDNVFCLWKKDKKNQKIISSKKYYLNSHFGISGIQCNKKYITFYIYYFKSKKKIKKFHFKSYNIKDIMCLYTRIEKIIYKKK